MNRDDRREYNETKLAEATAQSAVRLERIAETLEEQTKVSTRELEQQVTANRIAYLTFLEGRRETVLGGRSLTDLPEAELRAAIDLRTAIVELEEQIRIDLDLPR